MELFVRSRHYNNALPHKGGVQDQIAVVMEALAIVNHETSKVEAWQRHEAKIKADRENERQKRTERRRRS